MVLIFEVPTCAIFNIIENDFFSIQGLKFSISDPQGTVAGGEVIASRGVSAQFVCYDEPLRKGTDQAPYVSTRDP